MNIQLKEDLKRTDSQTEANYRIEFFLQNDTFIPLKAKLRERDRLNGISFRVPRYCIYFSNTSCSDNGGYHVISLTNRVNEPERLLVQSDGDFNEGYCD